MRIFEKKGGPVVRNVHYPIALMNAPMAILDMPGLDFIRI